jgi:L-fucose mutarotase
MLKGIDPLLHADLLHVLRAMGHGDDIVIVDCNFPAASAGRRVVRLDGVDAPRAARAILSVLPLDDFVDKPAAVMQVVGDPQAVPPVCREFQQVVDAAEGRHRELDRIERFAFYERTKAAFALVVTGERRLYGNLLLKKGIIRPEG